MKVVATFGVAGEADGLAIDDMNGAEGVPAPLAGHGRAAAENVYGNHGDVGAGGNQAEAGFRSLQFSVEGAFSFWEKHEGSLVLEHGKNMLEGRWTGRVLVDGNRADRGEEAGAKRRLKESVTGEVVGDPREATAGGRRIEITGVVGGKDEGAGR